MKRVLILLLLSVLVVGCERIDEWRNGPTTGWECKKCGWGVEEDAKSCPNCGEKFSKLRSYTSCFTGHTMFTDEYDYGDSCGICGAKSLGELMFTGNPPKDVRQEQRLERLRKQGITFD